jgi:erythromycin esterase
LGGKFVQRRILVIAAAAMAVFAAPSLAQTIPPEAMPATAEEESAAVAWLVAAGVAFDPSAYDAATLAPLAERLGSARVVGIGEATHGSHQDQAFKAELIKALVRSGKVTVLLLEANRDAGEQFDRYVRDGIGDPAEVMRAGSFFRIWKNDEFAGLLIWLRNWNKGAANPVRIVGIDCQDPGRDSSVALELITAHDSAAAAQLRAGLGGLVPGARFVEWLRKVERSEFDRAMATSAALAAWFDTAPAAARTDPGFARAHAAATTARQAFVTFELDRDDADKSKMDPAYFARRDLFMAENAVSTLAPEERAALWAHDLHVMGDLPAFFRAAGYVTLGAAIQDKLGADYLAVGFTWSKGAFHANTAADEAALIKPTTIPELEVFSLPNNRPGELGSLFDRTGARAMWIDLATLPTSPLIQSWSKRPYWRGWAGARVVPAMWQVANPETGDVPGDVATGHDVIVWFQTISPSHIWPVPPAPPAPAP